MYLSNSTQGLASGWQAGERAGQRKPAVGLVVKVRRCVRAGLVQLRHRYENVPENADDGMLTMGVRMTHWKLGGGGVLKPCWSGFLPSPQSPRR